MTLRNAAAAATAAAVALAIVPLVDSPTASAAPHHLARPAIQHQHPIAGAPVHPRSAPLDETRAGPSAPPAATVWPAATTARVDLAAGRAGHTARAVRALGTPVSLRLRAAGAAPPSAATATVQTLTSAAASRAHVAGLLFRVRRTDAATGLPATLSVDYARFADRFGGDWAQRLRLAVLPTCAAITPTVADCRRATPVRSLNDPTAHTVNADVSVPSTGAVFALEAGPSGPTGSLAATPLSDAGTWQVSTQGGGFDYSYPMSVPDVPGGLEPDVTANYSSSSVDGQTATTNNQPSWVGLGWDLGVGFIGRNYESCYDAYPSTPANRTGDECWGTDNASLSLGGHVSPLVRVNDSTWRVQDDEGATVQHLTGTTNGDDNGEYWVVTTTDGVKYYFGLNKLPGATNGGISQSTWTVPVLGADPENPRPGEAFTASARAQAYRWNLDYVVDPHGDAIAYYYKTQTNSYAERSGATTGSYVRAGDLVRADYGFRDGSTFSRPAAQVVFSAADRCVAGGTCATHNAANWPDVPWDQSCTAAPCGTRYAPTYWSTSRLDSVTTQVWTGTKYVPVDRWNLGQTYPDPGDGTGAGLWLHGITHSGLVGGTLATPEITFGGITYPNRVNRPSDGLPPMDKYRVNVVNNESGGTVAVQYGAPDCNPASFPAPDADPTRCFPQIWTPAGDPAPITDWFAKYVVTQTTQEDLVGGNPDEPTYYTYGRPGWRYNDNPLLPAARRTWSQWRGFADVKVITGAPSDPVDPQSEVDYLYYRGMNGNHQADGSTLSATVTDSQGVSVTDLDQDRGLLREQITRNGVGGGVVSDEVNSPWQAGPTATQGSLSAYMVETGTSVTRTALAGGDWRTSQIDTTFNSDDLPTQVSDLGDTSTADDNQCTTTTYASAPKPNLVDLVARTLTVAATCGTTPSFPADSVADVKTTYNAAGDALTTGTVNGFSGSTPQYVTTGTSTYDSFGRVLTSTDALGRQVTTAYTPATGPVTEQDVTDNAGQMTRTTLDPYRSNPLSVTDPGGNVTTSTYDALGRVTQVWRPDRATALTPSATFAYSTGTSAPDWTSTSVIDANGNYETSYKIADGFLRTRQEQSPAHGDKGATWRELTDTLYDTSGQVVTETAPYLNNAAPSGTLQATAQPAVPMETLTGYDGANRTTVVRHVAFGQTQTDPRGNAWVSQTSYGGNYVDVTPPAGTTPTRTYTDARGRTTEVRAYHGSAPSGDYDATRYTYAPAGQLATMTDASGNTWTYGYDVRGRRTSADDPDRGRTTTTYDDDGEVLSTTDPRGQTITNGYDARGNRIEEHDGSASGPLLASWTYDLATGRPTGTSSFAGGNEYREQTTTADPMGRPLTQTVTIPTAEKGLAGTYTTTTSYAPDGSPSTVKLPTIGSLRSETLTYGYDHLGAPENMVGTAYYVAQTAYGEDNSLEQLQFGPDTSAVWDTFTHDETTGRLASTSVQGLTAQIDTESYTYDASDNVTSQTDELSGQAVQRQCYSYDYLQRMTEAWATTAASCPSTAGASLGGAASFWNTYTYNAAGDRTSEVQHAIQAGGADTTTTYNYAVPGHTHALSGVSTTGPGGSSSASYSYDALGDTTSRPGPGGAAQTLSWDASGRLSAVSGNGTASYVYDASNNLLVTHDAGGATLQLPGGELHVNPSGTGAVATRYYTYAGRVVAVRSGTTLTWMAGDANGTPDLAVSSTTSAGTKHRTDPFGNPLDATNLPGDKGFVGGTDDPTTGLTTVGARDYDPALGRFVSVDPLISPTDIRTLDPYAYAGDSPVTYSDPSGLYTAGMGCPDRDCSAIPGGPHAAHPLGPPPRPRPRPARPVLFRCAAGTLYPCGSPFAPTCSSPARGCMWAVRERFTFPPKITYVSVYIPPRKHTQAPPPSRSLLSRVLGWPGDALHSVATVLSRGSISACISVDATAISVTAGASGCLSIDSHGISLNAGAEHGTAYGFEGSVTGGVMVSTDGAGEINSGHSTAVHAGGEAAGAKVDLSEEDSDEGGHALNAFVGGGPVFGAGIEGGPASITESVGGNSGVVPWKEVPAVLGAAGRLLGLGF